MFKILLVVPYPELEEVVKNVYQKEFKKFEFQLDILVIRAEDLKKDLLMEDYDILIGRGHSALKLKKLMPNKPVIEISITGYDVLRAIIESKKEYSGEKIGLFLSNQKIHDEKILKESLNIEIKTYIVPTVDKVIEALQIAKQEGIQTIIGGYSTVSEASAAGLNAIVIQTGEEAIFGVLTEAVGMMYTIIQEKNRNKTYQTILRESNEGIIYVNEGKVIEIVNRKAIQLLETQSENIRKQKVEKVFPYLTPLLEKLDEKQHYLVNELIQVGELMLSFDLTSVVVEKERIGTLITCRSVSKICQMETEIRKKLNEKGLVARYYFKDIIHISEVMENTIGKARKFAQVESNILIVGETGTGKELMAQSIHNNSSRQKGPFVAVNCAALPENLLESELFGYVDGAFTGSKKGGKTGVFEQANNGTLFLDEISELPVSFQGKLLRVLQERQVRKVGDDKVITVNVRIIAATNRNLSKEVKNGRFRQDLLYRLDILRLYIPPLRDRRDDIYPLFLFFLKLYNKNIGRDTLGCSKEARCLLEQYAFAGNIRELRNITERISVMTEKDIVEETLMKDALYPQDVGEENYFANNQENLKSKSGQMEEVGKLELNKEKILYALQQAKGRKGKAAQILEIDRTTLWRKMKEYHIE